MATNPLERIAPSRSPDRRRRGLGREGLSVCEFGVEIAVLPTQQSPPDFDEPKHVDAQFGLAERVYSFLVEAFAKVGEDFLFVSS